ncbi:MAG: carbohydrate ABC transporter permease [Planctomycetota bacterium]
MPSTSKKISNNLAIYVPLILFSIVTLIPFAYLASSAIKPKSVFFTSPFLPEAGLFAIDESTGDLTVVDVTLLPEADTAEVYEMTVAIRVNEADEASARTLRIGTASADAADLDFVIPADVEVNHPLGRVAPPEGVVPGDRLDFKIAEGNVSGLLGRAWGLLTLNNFDRLFNGVPAGDAPDAERVSTGIVRAVVNSFFFASVSAVLATLGAAMGGYALAKFRFRGRHAIDNLVLAALVIPGALLIAPGYQLLYWLGLLDSYAGLILPGIAPAFGVYLFRQAMITSLPDEMMEAARIDGCNEIKMFFIMALPMVRPMAGAFLLITYLGAWNNFIGPQIILQDPDKYPLAVWISQLRGVYGIDYGLIMAGTLVAITPVLILFLLLQKEFIAGLTAGAVKG